MIFDTSSSSIRVRLVGLFLMGVVLLFFAVQQLLTIWTPKGSLIPIKGTLESCTIYVTTVSSESRYGHESNSQKAELVFYLYEHKKKFALIENIGSDYRDEEYERIKSKLNRADSVTVWIKKSEVKYWDPEVFQIETDRENALDFQSVRFKDRPVTAFLVLMGLSCVLFPIYVFYPSLFSKKNEEKERRATTSAL